ncbi:MAG: DotU family type IV/VI secretion system protein [Fuerstiella sp.]
MATSVISLAEPFFLKVLQLLEFDAPDRDHLHRLQRQLTADLQAIEQKVNSGVAGISGGEWQTVKRVLVYWADEVLTRHMRDWDDYTLEQEYFGEQNRAWKFYVEGEEAIPTSGSEVAELFYLAIVLGFEGDIEDAFKEELRQEMPGGHQDDAEARRYWASQLQRRIRHDSAGDIQGEPLEGDVEPLGSNTVWKAGLASLLISALVFGIVLMWAFRGKEEETGGDARTAAPTMSVAATIRSGA